MNTNLENAKAQMRKGVLELCILSIIAEREAYPSDIIKKLKTSDLLVVEGTLYPLLTRLKDSGHLEYRWVESEQGPPRKYYQLTESGRDARRDMETAWNELVATVAKVTAPIPFNQNEIV
jgi:PadR family transcriptional regulator PadR